jgi:VanZ family protein
LKIFTRQFRYWLPVLIWLGIIAWESFRLSSNVTGGWMWRLVQHLHLRISSETLAEVNHVLRKAGHVSGYGILCLLVFRANFHTAVSRARDAMADSAHSISVARLRCAVFALSITLVTAVLDEWHQSFDPSRTSSAWDVAIDMTGALVFLLTALFALRLWRQAGGKVETISA